MADKLQTENTISSAVRNRSVAEGDVPETLRRRYYVDGRGGAGLGFYIDAKVKAAAFRDQGRRLAAGRTDPSAIRDMARIAQHRGWSIVSVKGEAGFRRETWLAGRALGIEVRGYRPTERDLQELERRINRTDRREASGRIPRPEQQEGREAARTTERIAEVVVKSRIQSPESQARIMMRARSQIAEWLEKGARFSPPEIARLSPGVVEPNRSRERTRDR